MWKWCIHLNWVYSVLISPKAKPNNISLKLTNILNQPLSILLQCGSEHAVLSASYLCDLIKLFFDYPTWVFVLERVWKQHRWDPEPEGAQGLCACGYLSVGVCVYVFTLGRHASCACNTQFLSVSKPLHSSSYEAVESEIDKNTFTLKETSQLAGLQSGEREIILSVNLLESNQT